MSRIYKEALSDAKKLREIAEQNAKNKIIEAVAPRIKQLIEAELMDDEAEELVDELEFFEPVEDEAAAVDDLVSPEGAALPSEEMPIALEPVALDVEGFEEPEAVPTEFSFEKDGKKLKVSVTVESASEASAKKIGGNKKYKMKKNSLGFLISALSEAKNNRQRKAILKEIRKIQKKLIIMSEAGDESSRTKLNALNLLIKEMKVMRRTRKTSRRLNENAWWLNEEDGEEVDELELDDDGAEEEVEEEAAEEVDVPAIEDAVSSLADALGMSLEEEGEEGDDLEDDADADLEDEEMDFEEFEEMDDEDGDKLDEDDGEGDDGDEVVEISESMIRREVARMRRARSGGKKARSGKAARARKLRESRRRRMARRRRLREMGDPVAAMHSYADEVIEVSEEDLINALADELGSSDGKELNIDGSGDASRAADAFGGGAAKGAALAERRLRRARKQINAANKKAASAKKELRESNLFNAKLLYVNKLMQSYDLNAKQQRAIVEALDNAKTLREAKLLYTTLTESLKKGRRTQGGTMTESVSRTGSASKSVRSGAPSNNGTELGRWAVLAGIK